MPQKKVSAQHVFILVIFFVALLTGSSHAAAAPVKNLIVLIMDGCGAEQLTLARWYKGAPLALDAICTGAVRTFTTGAVIADSAPAASAYATGVRTGGTMISFAPQAGAEGAVRPRATILEGARLLGKATGIVVTARVGHATPAAYVAHVPRRSLEEDINLQLVHQNLDVVFGGGGKMLQPGAPRGEPRDGPDLSRILEQRRYQLIDTAAALEKLTQPKVFGLFAASHLEPEIDRREVAPDQPTLAAMTKKAIELLATNPKGFFLMVEGSQIDWACHANDPAHLLGDLLMFDQAVQAALDFAQRDGQTLVLALADHNTGGMTIGNRRTDTTYTQVQPEDLVAPFKKMQLSATALWRQLGSEKTPKNIQAAVQTHWGIALKLGEARQIQNRARRYGKEGHYALGAVICPRYTDIGWTTHGHSGGDVPLFAYGPHRPVGLLEAPEIGQLSARALGLDLEALTARLFVDVQQAFPPDAVSLDRSDPKQPALQINYQNRQAILPLNTNMLYLDGQLCELEGVIVHHADNSTSYLPLQAVQLIKGKGEPLPTVAK